MDKTNRSIKRQIVLSFILLLVAIFGISGYFVYFNWLTSARQTTDNILASIGARIYRQIDRFVDISLNINSEQAALIQHNIIDIADDRKRDLFFANQIKTTQQEVYSFTYGMENGHFFGARRNPQNEIEVYKNNAQTEGKNRYYKVNPDLSTGAFVMETAQFDPRTRDWYQIAKTKQKAFFSPVYVHFVMNDLALSAAEPVYASNGQLLGVLGTHVTLSRLNQYLNTIVTDYGGIVYVVENPAGDLVANSQGKANFRQSGTQQIQRIKVDEIDEPEIVRAYLAWKNQRKEDAVSRQWFVETIVYDRLGLNWLIIAAIPQEPYLAPLMQGIYYSLFLTLIVIILAIFLYVKSTNIVLGPIRNLIQTTERFTAGEFSERAAVFRDDEIGVLSRAFNKMADEICHLINSLESKIKERTNELEQMNQVAKQAQEEAQSASEAKGAFLANVSHELRTPLNAILGYSELLQGDSELSRKNREYLGTIHHSGAHMLTLINDVLDIAKIESKKMSLSIGAFNLVAQLDDVTQMLKIRADAKKLEFIVVGQGSLPHYVLGDATKLRVVLINLIGNAIKFTEQGGVRVNFSATPVQESSVVFAAVVEDTGSGIPLEEQDKLFQFFSQTESGRLSQSGTGLGLAISQEYVRMMGGEIRVSSQVGVGSRFSFEVALAIAAGDVADVLAVKQRVIGLKPGHKPPRILVAEDTLESRTLLIGQMSMIGMEVLSAADGQEAVDQFMRYQPDFIWMDIRMPVMDGVEAARQIKATSQGSRTKIVALSAHISESEQKSLREAGFDGFVAKPYRVNSIYQTMAELLGLEFIYESEAEALVIQDADLPNWNGQALVLADDLRADLLAAVVRLDTNKISRIIDLVSKTNPETAVILAKLANNLEYSQMLRMLQSSEG